MSKAKITPDGVIAPSLRSANLAGTENYHPTYYNKKVGLGGLLVDQELADRTVVIAIVDHSNQCYNSSIPSLAPALFHPSASPGAPHYFNLFLFPNRFSMRSLVGL